MTSPIDTADAVEGDAPQTHFGLWGGEACIDEMMDLLVDLECLLLAQ
jgi:hypothetical protein